ncbi:MAG: response regulator transcription factor [Firmicutes bacterium]|jgi:two-component system alkaline phosphatase synthesis response regulator PhoP|nr:response regulator transcription factor [Bacillota bacterium]
MPEKILVVDDEEHILELLRYNLEREGYVVCLAKDGNQALKVAEKERPDLVILDLMLPGIDGLEVCRILRQISNVPIMMLTAKRGKMDIILGLELGADDYVTKPFRLRELLARVRAILRRGRGFEDLRPEEIIKHGDITIYPQRHEVLVGNTKVNLTAREFDILLFLARYPGRVFSREELIERLEGYGFTRDNRTIDVHVHHLREKIEVDAANPRYIKTVRGVGYKFEDPEQ